MQHTHLQAQAQRPHSRIPSDFRLPAGVQRKLQVGSAHDPQEHEADAVAEQVVNQKGNTPLVDTPVMRLIQRKCAACSKEEEGAQRKVQRMGGPEEEEKVQKKGAPEEEEKVQMKSMPGEEEEKVQMKGMPGEEEEKVQMKGMPGEEEEKVQMKGMPGEEEEKVQMKGMPGEEEEKVQMKGAPEEEEQVQMKGNGDGGFTATDQVSQRIKSQAGGGSPLPENTKAEMESGFGADFSAVRVHTGTEASALSRDLNAQAFTYGNDIFFNSGKLDTQSTEGKRLLAHELTHTVQQGAVKRKSEGYRIQMADESPALKALREDLSNGYSSAALIRISFLSEADAYTFVSTSTYRDLAYSCFGNFEMYQAMKSIKGVGLWWRLYLMFEEGTSWSYVKDILTVYGSKGGVLDSKYMKDAFISLCGDDEMFEAVMLISGHLKYKLEWMLDEGTSKSSLIRVLMASGSATERADVLADTALKARVDAFLNYDREVNKVDTHMDITKQMLERKSVCGPNITKQLEDAVTLAGTTFSGWNDDEKADHCLSLVALDTGAIAWDINELYNKNHGWILNYRPACATAQNNTNPKAADELCGNTVEVSKQCHYAGSPNYIIFGKMMKLCNGHYNAKKLYGVADRYSRRETENLVRLYKGRSIVTGWSPSPNFENSLAFALRGFDGTGDYPLGDRPGCFPSCPTSYSGSAFTVRWSSHEEDKGKGR